MLQGFLTYWWSVVIAYFAGPAALASGKVTPFTVLPVLGLVMFAIGLVLVIVTRERRAVWLIGPFVLSALMPILLRIGEGSMGWFGMSFVLTIGALLVLIWVGIIASNGNRRAGPWVLGLSSLSFVAFAGYASIAMIWGLG